VSSCGRSPPSGGRAVAAVAEHGSAHSDRARKGEGGVHSGELRCHGQAAAVRAPTRRGTTKVSNSRSRVLGQAPPR
jgi:hypothetical protein